MPQKKTKFDVAVAKAAKIIGEQLESLAPTEAKAKRLELHRLATKSFRSA